MGEDMNEYKPNEQYFTLVFEGSIRDLDSNPFLEETVFGKCVAAGVGNAFEECRHLEERIAEAREATR
jgi:hypothetical protein